jgi:hypothetical protein
MVTVLGAGLFAVTVGSTVGDSSGTAAYDAKVRFERGHTLRFPDFELTYAGKRHVEPPQYPRGWWVYDFTVRSKTGERTVSWSAGTGDIAPARFTVNGAEFQLELSHSDKLGPLRDDEMVVGHLLRRE